MYSASADYAQYMLYDVGCVVFLCWDLPVGRLITDSQVFVIQGFCSAQ